MSTISIWKCPLLQATGPTKCKIFGDQRAFQIADHSLHNPLLAAGWKYLTVFSVHIMHAQKKTYASLVSVLVSCHWYYFYNEAVPPSAGQHTHISNKNHKGTNLNL